MPIPRPSSNKVHDLHLITVPYHDRVVPVTLDDGEVVFDGDATSIDVQSGEQGADADGSGDLVRLAVQAYGQSLPQR